MITSDELIEKAKCFRKLADQHRATAASCDMVPLPPEYGDYERGMADAYDVAANAITTWGNQ